MNRSALGGVALLLVIATATSCADDPETAPDPDPSPSNTPSSTAPPTPEAPTPGAKALVQLEAYLDVRDDALRTLKVNRKRLDKVAGGQEYTSIQQRVIEYASNKFTLSLDPPMSRG